VRLILVRHGQTRWNSEKRIQGWQDSELTPQARAGIQQLTLPDLHHPVIYSSDLGRAYQSARLLADRFSAGVVQDKRLRERCFGILEGRVIDQVPELAAHWQSYHQRYQHTMTDVPGVETESVFEQRIYGFLQYLAHAHGAGDIILVSHGEWLRALDNILSGLVSWHKGAGIPLNGEPRVIQCNPGSWHNEWEKSA
jgi:probable phosphoglycerate mutase